MASDAGAAWRPGLRRDALLREPYETDDLESYRYALWTAHPNTAKYMAGITGVTERIKEHAEYMAERVFGVQPEWQGDELAIIRPRDIFLRIVTPAGFAELYPELDYSRERVLPSLTGVTVAVESIDTATDVLDQNGLEYHAISAGRVAVARADAANTVVEFVPSA